MGASGSGKTTLLKKFPYEISGGQRQRCACVRAIADWGDMQAGFQTMALPLLIVMIMAVPVNHINHFIIKQRAKEFATYMLLGMEKDKLSLVFLCELFVIGLVCFLLGVTLGTGIFSVCYHTLLLETESHSIFRIILKSVLQTFV